MCTVKPTIFPVGVVIYDALGELNILVQASWRIISSQPFDIFQVESTSQGMSQLIRWDGILFLQRFCVLHYTKN